MVHGANTNHYKIGGFEIKTIIDYCSEEQKQSVNALFYFIKRGLGKILWTP